MAWIARKVFGKHQVSLYSIWNFGRSNTGISSRFNLLSRSGSGPPCVSLFNSKNGSLSQSVDLEKIIGDDLKSGKILTAFQRLTAASDGALCALTKKMWGSLFYCLNQNAEYDKLDTIRNRTSDLGVNCGEGAYTTLIHSYITRGQVLQALGILNDMKDKGLLRHSRTYFAVIMSLAKKGHQRKAFELFEEMQNHVFKSKKSVSLVIPSDMSVALIRSCIEVKKEEISKIEKKINITDYGKAKDVLRFYNQSGRSLTLQILEATKDWLSNDPINNWTTKQCQVSTEGLCNSCFQPLDSGELMSTDNDALQKNLLCAIQDIFEQKGNKKESRFKSYKEFLEICGPFDIIIDGMNIGFSSAVSKQAKKFNFEVLYDVANHFTKQEKKILVIVNTSVPRLSLLKDCQLFVTDVGCDDLYIIYACAVSSMKPFIVSRDKLRDHRFFLDFGNWSHYLQWIRLHTVKVGLQNNILTFNMQCYDPVVQEGKTGWHFPVVGGRWFCAQKS